MEWNAESVLDALNDFERRPDITPLLDSYLLRIAQNGETIFPWCKLKPLLKKKLELVLTDFNETCTLDTTVPVPNFEAFNFENLKKTILQAVENFTSAPFTIQRLCELVTDPHKHYNRTDKYMRGIEKNVLVVSTIEPDPYDRLMNLIGDSPHKEGEGVNGHEDPDVVTSASNHVLENFANAFSSAACIPSPSKLCFKVSPPGLVPDFDVDFDQQLSDDQKEDEAMDTSEDEASKDSDKKDEDADSSEAEMVQEAAAPNEAAMEEEASTSQDPPSDEPEKPIPESESSEMLAVLMDEAPPTDECTKEVETDEAPPVSPQAPSQEDKVQVLQQDDTISQSDSSCQAAEVEPSTEESTEQPPTEEVEETSEAETAQPVAEVKVPQLDDSLKPVLQSETVQEAVDTTEETSEAQTKVSEAQIVDSEAQVADSEAQIEVSESKTQLVDSEDQLADSEAQIEVSKTENVELESSSNTEDDPA